MTTYKGSVRPVQTSLYWALLQDARREIVTAALISHNGSRTHAARALGIQRTYLTRLIRELDIHDAATLPQNPS